MLYVMWIEWFVLNCLNIFRGKNHICTNLSKYLFLAFGQTEIWAFLVFGLFHLSLLRKVNQSPWKVVKFSTTSTSKTYLAIWKSMILCVTEKNRMILYVTESMILNVTEKICMILYVTSRVWYNMLDAMCTSVQIIRKYQWSDIWRSLCFSWTPKAVFTTFHKPP